jgi:5-methylcytosine-specific restriction protein A
MNQPCLEPGCPGFAEYRGRCRSHASEYAARREPVGKAVYNSKRWAMLRRRKLNLNPICEDCDARLATDVHHRHGVEVDPWSLAGLESLCHSCHSKVTRREQVAA